MVNIIVDTCAFSKTWVKSKVIPDILSGNIKTKVIYSPTNKWSGEVSKVAKYLEFIKLLKIKKKLVVIDEKKSDVIEKKISSISKWKSCSDCDDEHLFAACLLVKVGYVITDDTRLCQCRKVMKNNIPKKISRKKVKFSAISNEKLYDKLRNNII